jgi:hypothetical protein
MAMCVSSVKTKLVPAGCVIFAQALKQSWMLPLKPQGHHITQSHSHLACQLAGVTQQEPGLPQTGAPLVGWVWVQR